MEQLITDRLRENLTRLNLIRASEVLQTIAEQAEADKRSYLSFLDQLLEEEVAVKEKRRFQTAMKTAGLPTAKSIDEYDFSFHPQLNKKEIMALFDMDFIAKKENVIFLGPPWVGKARAKLNGQKLTVSFPRRAHNPILRSVPWQRLPQSLSWLDGIGLELKFK